MVSTVSASSHFTGIANETIIEIASYLNETDTSSFRQVSKQMQACSCELFRQLHFSTLTHDLSCDSLKALNDIADNDRLNSAVQTVSIVTSRLSERGLKRIESRPFGHSAEYRRGLKKQAKMRAAGKDVKML